MRKMIYFTVVGLLLAAVASGNGLSLNGVGTRAIAMGNAYYGIADDYSALYWNPAGLTDIDGIEINGTFTAVYPKATYGFRSAWGDVRINTESTNGFFKYIFPNGSFAYDGLLGGKMAFGVSTYVPASMGVVWGGNDLAPLVQGDTSDWETKIGMFEIAPGAAFQLHPMISIGGAFYIDYVMTEMKFPVVMGMPPNQVIGHFSEDASGIGYSGVIGVKVKPHPMFHAGFSFKPKRTITTDGTANIPELGQMTPPMPTSSGFSRDVRWPMELMFGVAVMPTNKLTIGAGGRYLYWEDACDRFVATYDNPYWQDYMDRAGADEWVLNWENTVQFNVGAEYRVHPMFDVRGGYYRDPSPAPNSTYTILLPGCDWNAITFGTGAHVSKLDINFAFEYLMGKERNVNTWTADNMLGEHNINTMSLNISVTYHP
jgi:long-chain fatty acid transport protein